MGWKSRGGWGIALLLAGCLAAQRPYEFLSHLRSEEEPTDALARALAQVEQPPVEVNRTLALVRTRWDVSDFAYGQVGGEPAVVVRRYLASWQGARGGTAVKLELQLLACARATVRVVQSGSDVKGACLALEGGVPGPFQAELDQLGARLAKAIERLPPAVSDPSEVRQ